MEIKVLGAGCAKCRKTYAAIEKAIAENRLDATLVRTEEITELLVYGILTTPAVVVDGTVKIKGHVPTESEIRKLLGI